MIEIFCPCKKEDLRQLVQFLHDGEIHCEYKADSNKIFEHLAKIFGFPEDMHLQCQEKALGEYSEDTNICEVIEDYTITQEAFENNTNESVCGEKFPFIGL